LIGKGREFELGDLKRIDLKRIDLKRIDLKKSV